MFSLSRAAATPLLAAAVLLLALGALGATAQPPGAAAPAPTPLSDATHKQLPTMPIVVDGVRYEPADFVQKFEGVPVYMVYDEATLKSEGVLCTPSPAPAPATAT